MQSQTNSLNTQDWQDWLVQTTVYSLAIPVSLAFLQGLQGGLDWKGALFVAATVLLQAAVNLLGKYKAGPQATPNQTTV